MVRILMQAADAAGGGAGAGSSGAAGASGAPSDDALAPPDPADIADDNEGAFEEEPPADEPEPKKPAAEARTTGPAKKPDAKRPPPAAPKKKPAAEEEAKGEEEPAQVKPEDEEYEYEWDEVGEDGKPVKFKEKLTKAEVNKLLARRKKLDTEAFARITHANKLRGPVEDLFKQVKQNPLAIFDIARMAGADPHQAAQAYAAEWKRQQELTPEQRAFEEREAELSRQKDDLDQKQAKLDKDEADKKFQQKRGKVLTAVTGALEAAKMPRHPTVLQLVGDHLAAQVRGQPEEFEPDYGLAVEAAQDGLREASAARLNGLTYEDFLAEFPEVVKKIRTGDAARVKGAPGSTGKLPPPPAPAKKVKEEPKFLSPQEWGDKMRAREE